MKSLKSGLLIVAAVSALVGLTGCEVLAGPIAKSAKAAGKAVTFYCDNVTSQELREEYRGKVNEYAAPNSIVVTCANGNKTLKSSQ